MLRKISKNVFFYSTAINSEKKEKYVFVQYWTKDCSVSMKTLSLK